MSYCICHKITFLTCLPSSVQASAWLRWPLIMILTPPLTPTRESMKIHMMGAMTNPMTGVLRLCLEKLLLRTNSFGKKLLSHMGRSHSSLFTFPCGEGEESVFLKKTQSPNWT